MIKANFKAYSTYVTDSLHQWDLNQVLEVTGLNLTSAPEVHFSNKNMDRAIPRQSTMTNHVIHVDIPNSLLQDPLRIYAHIGVYEGDTFKVVELVEIPVIPRKRPEDYQIEVNDQEVYSFKALENALQNRATQAETRTLGARIDAIVANANKTDGNSEMVDLRVGADGKTYASAGAAVRGQFETMPVAKNIERLMYASIEIDTAAGTVSVVAEPGKDAYAYTNDDYYWFKELTGNVLDYRSMAASEGSDASWAYVIDPVGGCLTFRLLGCAPTHVHRIRNTDRILFTCLSTAAGNINVFQGYCNGIYLNGELQPHISQLRQPWNRIVGSLDAKIEIDTNAKTVSMNGIFFLESGMWKNLNTTLDLTGFRLGSSGGTARVLLNENGALEITDVSNPARIGDVFVCEIFASNTWGFDAARVYTSNATKALIYVDGVQLLADASAVKKDVDVLKAVHGIGKTTCNIFKKVVCCGDSYTSGHMTDPDGNAHSVMEDYAWPRYMARATGADWINCGQSGANVLTWQTAGRGLTKAREAGKAQAYLVGLMINDCGTSVNGIPLGTASDIGTEAQTYYGGMSAIIRELNAISPKAKIFVQTCPVTGGNFDSYNQAVRDVVDAYKNTYPVHCLDLLAYKDMYALDSLTGDALAGHYTAIGYEQFAEILQTVLSEYINQNIKDFQDVPFIEY